MLAITHYNRLLSELRADHVHILVRGQIVAEGGPELADELETSGYAAFTGEPEDARCRATPGGAPRFARRVVLHALIEPRRQPAGTIRNDSTSPITRSTVRSSRQPTSLRRSLSPIAGRSTTR